MEMEMEYVKFMDVIHSCHFSRQKRISITRKEIAHTGQNEVAREDS